VDVAEYSTMFNINNDLKSGTVDPYVEGVSSFAEVYETDEGKFAGVKFELLPHQVNTIKVYQEITMPFNYYLDSLSTFTKADHEKITVYGDVNVEFNEHYPVEKNSNNEYAWEYSDIDTNDDNLKDILIISYKNHPPEPNKIYPLPIIAGIIIFTIAGIILFIRKRKK